MEKHIKVLYGLMIVGFLSLSAQVWLQTQAINELNIKMEAVRELLFRFAWLSNLVIEASDGAFWELILSFSSSS